LQLEKSWNWKIINHFSKIKKKPWLKQHWWEKNEKDDFNTLWYWGAANEQVMLQKKHQVVTLVLYMWPWKFKWDEKKSNCANLA
jgi:hypothetical protein